MKQLSILLATGFGLGLSPVASGTVGTLLGLPLVYGLAQVGALPFQIGVVILLSLLAVPICSVAEKHFQTKDDGRIVADEYLTFPICMLGLPLHPVVLLVAFLSNRFFDIVKIPPAFQLQRLKGGWGIVMDDVVAALYSLAFNHLAVYLMKEFGVLSL